MLNMITDDEGEVLLRGMPQNSQFWPSWLIRVSVEIVLHIITKIVKHALIWPVIDCYVQQY
jgi:hypothetical protein